MEKLRIAAVIPVIAAMIGCGGGSGNSPINNNPAPQQQVAPASLSIHDTPPAGVTVLSFQATITGIAMQPGNVSLLNTPVTLEMTQLQGMSAYLGTISVPVGNYTSMIITLANPQMTFLNDTGAWNRVCRVRTCSIKWTIWLDKSLRSTCPTINLRSRSFKECHR